MSECFTTYTGLSINPLALRPEDICIEDIAHSLSLCNRFTGHTMHPISVAQHSVFVSLLSPMNPLQGLLHDASEAYLGDVTRLLKKSSIMEGYKTAEDKAQRVIGETLGCELVDLPLSVRLADNVMVRYEAMQGGLNFAWSEAYPYPSIEEQRLLGSLHWMFVTHYEAEKMFLDHYRKIREGR